MEPMETIDLENQETLHNDSDLPTSSPVIDPTIHSAQLVRSNSDFQYVWNAVKIENETINATKDMLLECLIHRDKMIQDMESKQNNTHALLQSAEKTKYDALVSLKTIEVKETLHRYDEKALKMEVERLQSEIALLNHNCNKNVEELAALQMKHKSTLCQIEIDLKAKTEELKKSYSTVCQLTETNRMLTTRLENDRLKLEQHINKVNILNDQSKQLEAKAVLSYNVEHGTNQLLLNDLIEVNRKIFQLLNENTSQCAVFAKISSIGNGATNKNSTFGETDDPNEIEDFNDFQQISKDEFKKHIQMSEKQNETYMETINNYKSITNNLSDENVKIKSELLAAQIRCEHLNVECSRLKYVNETCEIEHEKLKIDHKILQDKFALVNKQIELLKSENRIHDTDLTEEQQTSLYSPSFTTANLGGRSATVSNAQSHEDDSIYTDNENMDENIYSDGENNSDDESDKSIESNKSYKSNSSEVIIIEDNRKDEIINIDSDTDENENLQVSNLGNSKDAVYFKEHHVEEKSLLDNIDDNASHNTGRNYDNVQFHDEGTAVRPTTESLLQIATRKPRDNVILEIRNLRAEGTQVIL